MFIVIICYFLLIPWVALQIKCQGGVPWPAGGDIPDTYEYEVVSAKGEIVNYSPVHLSDDLKIHEALRWIYNWYVHRVPGDTITMFEETVYFVLKKNLNHVAGMVGSIGSVLSLGTGASGAKLPTLQREPCNLDHTTGILAIKWRLEKKSALPNGCPSFLVGFGTANSYRSASHFNGFVCSAGRCPGSISTFIVFFQAAWFFEMLVLKVHPDKLFTNCQVRVVRFYQSSPPSPPVPSLPSSSFSSPSTASSPVGIAGPQTASSRPETPTSKAQWARPDLKNTR